MVVVASHGTTGIMGIEALTATVPKATRLQRTTQRPWDTLPYFLVLHADRPMPSGKWA
jgi:hypothetical protein